MAERPILRSPAAEDDLVDIAKDNRRAADRMLDTIARRLVQLATFPESGPLRPDIAADARALTVGSYLVLYRNMPTHVEIMRVVHGARDVTALL